MAGVGYTVPLPLEDCHEKVEVDHKRLWVGNIDLRITEYVLLKILQKHGTLDKFDFLYHKGGPDKGKPRGYCFVTFKTEEEARKAIKALNGKIALSKKLSVRYAHVQKEEELRQNYKPVPQALAPPQPKAAPSEVSVETKIRAIEAKLKLMENNEDNNAHHNPAISLLKGQAPDSSSPASASSLLTKSRRQKAEEEEAFRKYKKNRERTLRYRQTKSLTYNKRR